MWYENTYRRHLLDMHIDDWDDRFLSEFNADDYFDNLKRAKLNNAMIYLQSHAGHCHYPTKSGHLHRCLESRPHEVKRLVDKCRSNGIYVTGYYSLIYNTYEHDKHPEWRMVGADGYSTRAGSTANTQSTDFASTAQSRYGHCCPNNPGYREFVKEQMREMAEYFTVDAMFFDMLFWSYYCYCDHCKKRWAQEVGGEIPTVADFNDPMWLKHRERRRVWMGEFAQFVTDYQKELTPGMPVEHNVSAMMHADGFSSCSSLVNDACDYAGGDLYGDIYNHSFTCKFYKNASRNQPFEYMFSRCQPGLRNHTMTKPCDVMLSSVMMTAAHHGATLVIDAIDPVGTMDSRVYDMLGQIFEFEQKYEPYFKGNMVEDIGVYYSLKSKYTPHEGSMTSHTGAVNAVKTMLYYNVPVGVTGDFYKFDGYKVLVAPCHTQEDAADDVRILDYVRNGGNLYISTAWNAPLVKELLDAEILGDTIHNLLYLAPAEDSMGILDDYTVKYPMNFDGHASQINLNGNDCKVLATLTLPYTDPTTSKFASIHSNPPGIATDIPGLVYRKYGKGTVIWSAVPIECCTDELCREVFANIINVLMEGEKQSFVSDAPINAELTLFKDDKTLYLNAVNLNEYKKLMCINSFTVKVYTENEPVSVKFLPDGDNVEYSFKDGYTCFNTGELKYFDMSEIVCK